MQIEAYLTARAPPNAPVRAPSPRQQQAVLSPTGSVNVAGFSFVPSPPGAMPMPSAMLAPAVNQRVDITPVVMASMDVMQSLAIGSGTQPLSADQAVNVTAQPAQAPAPARRSVGVCVN